MHLIYCCLRYTYQKILGINISNWRFWLRSHNAFWGIIWSFFKIRVFYCVVYFRIPFLFENCSLVPILIKWKRTFIWILLELFSHFLEFLVLYKFLLYFRVMCLYRFLIAWLTWLSSIICYIVWGINCLIHCIIAFF